MEARDHCLLCLQQLSTCAAEGPFTKEHGPSATSPLEDLCHFLKVKMREDWSNNESLETSAVVPELCEGCHQMSKTFSEHFLDLQEIQKKLYSCLKSIHDRMVGAQEKAESSLQSGSLRRFRRETFERCSRKLNKRLFQLDIPFPVPAVPKPCNEVNDSDDPSEGAMPDSDDEIKMDQDMEDPLQLPDEDEVEDEHPIESRSSHCKEERDTDDSDNSCEDGQPDADPLDTHEDSDAAAEIKVEERDEDPTWLPEPDRVGTASRLAAGTGTGKLMYKKIAGIAKYQCRLCPKQSNSVSYINTHYKSTHLQLRYSCDLCPKTFPYQVGLKRHHEQTHLKVRHKCQQCSKLFTIKANLTNHQTLCGPNATGGNPCHLCGKRFPGKHKLFQHLRQVHSPGFKPVEDEFTEKQKRKFKCKLCPQEFKYSNLLWSHKRRVHRGLEFKCGTCSKVFTQLSSLKRHQATPTIECFVSDTSKSSRVPPVEDQAGTNSEIWNCPICDLQFPQKNLLWGHQRAAHGGAVFSCQKCDKVYTQLSSLNRHLANPRSECGPGQSSKKPPEKHVCHVCGKVFVQAKGLEEHINSLHFKSKEYLCPHCGKRAKSKSNLYKHVKTVHSEARDHLCDICGKGFTMQCNLNHHKRYVHEKKGVKK